LEEAYDTCWVCGGLFKNLDSWVDDVSNSSITTNSQIFWLALKLTGRLAENEEILWAESKTTTAEPLKSALNRELGKRIELLTGKQAEFSRPDILLIVDLARDKIEIHANPLFFVRADT